MRLAYLCNLYPAVSHSFVRREIGGVEQAGHEVHRFSLRSAKADLKDEADLRELARTHTVLAQGFSHLAAAALVIVASRPVKSLRALGRAYRLSAPGFRSKVKHAGYWLEAAWLALRWDKLGIEHVHAHFGTNSAAVALLAHALGGPPFSFTVHGPDEFDAPISLALEEKIAAATFVAAISNYGRSQLMRWSAPEMWKKIGIVRCGIDAGFLQVSESPSPANSTNFVCVARLSAQKGLPLLVAACDRLRRAGEHFSVTIIGDGDMRAEIDQDIRRRGLDGVVSLAGIRTAPEIRQHLLDARAFVLPSFAEGLPVVLMEALALCRPVITTAIAGIPELVDLECGWLIPPGSEDALVQAMKEALNSSPDELATKGAVGRKRVHLQHDVNANAAHLMSAISAHVSGPVCTGA